jgi:hypothetical protein
MSAELALRLSMERVPSHFAHSTVARHNALSLVSLDVCVGV